MVEMNFKTKISVSLITIISIFVIGLIVGAGILTGIIHITDQGSVPDSVSAPTWDSGQFWTYSFKTPEIDDAVSRVVVASEEDGNYMVGVASRTDAQRHGVLNYNPMLGRISIEKLAVYEKGVAQPLFDFPLKDNAQWKFCMFGIEGFNARVKSIDSIDIPGYGRTYLVNIEAKSSGGAKLTYSYDTKAEWIRSMVLESSSGQSLLEMTLVSYGNGFAGDVFFVRGMDIFDNSYLAPAADTYRTYISGHPQWGPFDSLIYHFTASTGDNSRGVLVLMDPAAPNEAKEATFGPNTFESTLGSITSVSDELSISVTLIGEASLHLRVAGGIEYFWTV
jgi:hypothetical protein